MYKSKIITLLCFLLLTNSCTSQTNNKNNMTTRQTAVAGMFYSSSKDKLSLQLQELFSKAEVKSKTDVLAIISPHAGYLYSGTVAASAFNQIEADKEYKTIFIIGASHIAYFNGASIYNIGNFITPLGEVEVDTAIANKLIKENPLFGMDASYHLEDHCIEVQLPFLQYILKKKFRIVPVIIGTSSEEVCRKLAQSLKPYFNNENLFVFSTDFSHYPSYTTAIEVDKNTCDAIISNSAAVYLKTIKINESKKINNLATSICGHNAILTMLYITESMNNISIEPIIYKNSGDFSNESNKVVGYWALTVSEHKNSGINNLNKSTVFSIGDKEEQQLIYIARTTLENYIHKGIIPKIDSSILSEKLKESYGAFVTLKKDNKLRGCIGRFTTEKPLYQIVQDMTISASTQDYRFEKVSPKELDHIKIEISILSPLKKINSIDEIIMGTHGIYIKKGGNSGTFLPQVANETGWTKEEFLGHCAEDKAGIGWYGWKTADIFIYTTVVIEEK